MALPKPCEDCGSYYPRPVGKSKTRYCARCCKIRFIKHTWKRYGKYKDFKSLEEALAKYGK